MLVLATPHYLGPIHAKMFCSLDKAQKLVSPKALISCYKASIYRNYATNTLSTLRGLLSRSLSMSNENDRSNGKLYRQKKNLFLRIFRNKVGCIRVLCTFYHCASTLPCDRQWFAYHDNLLVQKHQNTHNRFLKRV